MSKTAVEHSLQCSFCHKRQETVGKLIASAGPQPRAYICDECIALCAAIIEDDAQQAPGGGAAQEPEPVDSPARVFVLQHARITNDNKEEVKLIGVYSTRARAEKAAVRLRPTPEFCESQEGFSIGEYPIDADDSTTSAS